MPRPNSHRPTDASHRAVTPCGLSLQQFAEICKSLDTQRIPLVVWHLQCELNLASNECRIVGRFSIVN